MELKTGKPGRKPKGDRVQIPVKVPTSLKPVLDEAAAKLGLPLTDYVAVVLATHLGEPMPSYLQKDKNQEALPIGA